MQEVLDREARKFNWDLRPEEPTIHETLVHRGLIGVRLIHTQLEESDPMMYELFDRLAPAWRARHVPPQRTSPMYAFISDMRRCVRRVEGNYLLPSTYGPQGLREMFVCLAAGQNMNADRERRSVIRKVRKELTDRKDELVLSAADTENMLLKGMEVFKWQN